MNPLPRPRVTPEKEDSKQISMAELKNMIMSDLRSQEKKETRWSKYTRLAVFVRLRSLRPGPRKTILASETEI